MNYFPWDLWRRRMAITQILVLSTLSWNVSLTDSHHKHATHSTNYHPRKNNYIVPFTTQMPTFPQDCNSPGQGVFLHINSSHLSFGHLDSSVPSLLLFFCKNVCFSLPPPYSSDEDPSFWWTLPSPSLILYLGCWMWIEKCNRAVRFTLNSWSPASNGHLKTAQQAFYFSLVGLLTCSLKGLFYTSFSLLKPPTFLPLYSQMMTSHFMDKIEKSSSFHQTCNLHWGPFSFSLLWLKWKYALLPIKVQSLLSAACISSPQILSSLGYSFFTHYQPSLSYLTLLLEIIPRSIISCIYEKQTKQKVSIDPTALSTSHLTFLSSQSKSSQI